MKMEINYSSKIKKINDERIIMLKMTKDSLSDNNKTLVDSLNNICSTLYFDDLNSKEYKSISKAKELIYQLTEEISSAKSIDDIVNLRNKINYYINKIKKELLKRNISQKEYNEMNSKVDSLRKNISGYIRYLKRNSMLSEINDLNDNFDNLINDDKVILKRLINNEIRFNNRYYSSFNNNNNNTGKDNIVLNISTEISEDNQDSLDIDVSKLKDIDDNEDINFNFNFNISNKNVDESYLNFEFSEKYLLDNVEHYAYRYKFSELLEYDGVFFKNILTFFRNIPRYSLNKKLIKSAERDYNMFYHGKDLNYFINYSKKRNSIRTALDIIFKSSRLSKREIECLYNHSKCKEWINEFYNQQNVNQDNMSLVRIK